MKEFTTRVFKSGNSVAIRLPKSAGVAEGEEVRIVPHSDGTFSFHRIAGDKAAFMALAGTLSEGFMAEGRGDIEQPERDWSPGSGAAEAA